MARHATKEEEEEEEEDDAEEDQAEEVKHVAQPSRLDQSSKASEQQIPK